MNFSSSLCRKYTFTQCIVCVYYKTSFTLCKYAKTNGWIKYIILMILSNESNDTANNFKIVKLAEYKKKIFTRMQLGLCYLQVAAIAKTTYTSIILYHILLGL